MGYEVLQKVPPGTLFEMRYSFKSNYWPFLKKVDFSKFLLMKTFVPIDFFCKMSFIYSLTFVK